MTLKDVTRKTIFPILFIIFWYYMVNVIMGVLGITELFYFIMLMGLPFGIRKMFLLIIPANMDIGATVGMMALGVLLSALIGVVFIPYYIVRAIYVLFRYIFRL